MPSNSTLNLERAPIVPAPVWDDLGTKLVWLTMFRIVATTLLLGVLAVRILQRPQTEGMTLEDALSFGVLGAVYVVNLFYGVLLRLGWGGKGAAYVQVLGDVVIASCLVYLSGGVESPFTITYALAVVAACALLPHPAGLVVATVSSVVLTAMGLTINRGLLRLPFGADILPPVRLLVALSTNVVAQFATAALGTYLSRQLTEAGGMLTAREEDLRKLDRLQRQILAHMPSGLLTCDSSGIVTFINRAGRHILGMYAEAPLQEQSVEAFLPGIRNLGIDGSRHDLTVATPAGPRVLGLAATALDEPGALLVVFQDLTDLRRMQVQLERSDRLAALGKLSAQLAHEIRNPLAAMRGSAQMLASESERAPSIARLSHILVREADRLGRLVEEFLRFARPPEPRRRPTRLKTLVEETVMMLRSDPLAASARIEQDVEDMDLEVDPDQLRQVLLNLLRNALEAAGREGTVRVKARISPHAVVLSVWDSAGSIPPANMGRLFEPFFTTRSGGTGLGLSTAHAIVRAHDGTIEVHSSKEEGTQFTVTLPILRKGTPVASVGGG